MKNEKNIRSKFVKESLLDMEALTNTVQENTTGAVKNMLSDKLRDELNKIVTEAVEDDDKSENDFDIEEVDDTESETDSSSDDDTEGTDDIEVSDDTEEVGDDDTEEMSVDSDTENGDEWSEFEKYKVSDDEYDFSTANDDEIVKVWKLLKDDDVVSFKQEGDTIELKDNETGNEYEIELGNGGEGMESSTEEFGEFGEDDDEISFDDESSEMSADSDMEGDDFSVDSETEESFEGEEDDDDDVFEIALKEGDEINEYDSHVGYTDNYQDKDVMTTDGMTEPAKASETNDWNAGTPKGTKKPWVGKKEKGAPFTEEDETNEDEDVVEEGGARTSVKIRHKVKSAKSNGSNPHMSTRRPNSDGGVPQDKEIAEMRQRLDDIMNENRELKKALVKFRNNLREAAVINVNLGQVIKLMENHATTKEEKRDIIARFGSEAKTIEESKRLYDTISRELGKKAINEAKIIDKPLSTAPKAINETTVYQSKDLLDALSLIHRLDRI